MNQAVKQSFEFFCVVTCFRLVSSNPSHQAAKLVYSVVIRILHDNLVTLFCIRKILRILTPPAISECHDQFARCGADKH